MKQNSPVDIEAIYNSYLDKKQEQNYIERYKDREHYYHASGAGSCSRKLYFQSVIQAEPTEDMDDGTKRLLRLGNVVHDDLQKSLELHNRDILYKDIHNRDISIDSINIEKEKENKEKENFVFHTEQEILIEELNVRGFYDIVAEKKDKEVYLYDIKTCNEWSWKMKFGRNKTFNPSIHYELQLGTYGYAIKKEMGRLDGMYLYYYNKNNSSMRCVSVPLTFVSRAYLFLSNIKDEHEQGLPPFRKGVSPVQDWQCKYCQFNSVCNPPT